VANDQQQNSNDNNNNNNKKTKTNANAEYEQIGGLRATIRNKRMDGLIASID
jgi:hypothetical protein